METILGIMACVGGVLFPNWAPVGKESNCCIHENAFDLHSSNTVQNVKDLIGFSFLDPHAIVVASSTEN